MIREELELNYDEMLDSSDVNGITIIWTPSESKLIIDDKITDIIEGYNIKNQTLEQFILFIYEEDKENMLNFFTKDLNKSYINREQVQQRYKIKDIKGNLVEFILIGKVIKNNYDYYFIGTSHLFGTLNQECNDVNFWMNNWRKSVVNKKFNSIIQCDRITGLPSKYFFKNVVSNLLKNVIHNNTRATMILIDLDNF